MLKQPNSPWVEDRYSASRLLVQLSERIKHLPSKNTYSREDLLLPEFLLAEDRSVRVYFVPFGHVNSEAKVVLLGLTPGWQQMEAAIREARVALLAGDDPDQVSWRAKGTAAFVGTMRKNLCAMLDELGLPSALGLSASSDLFEHHRPLVHTTSALQYPVFKSGENYSGTPNPTKNKLLRSMIDHILRYELQNLEHAIIVPLGKAVEQVLGYMADQGWISTDRVLFGFPHPSGANGHRVRLFEENRAQMAQRVAVWKP